MLGSRQLVVVDVDAWIAGKNALSNAA